jgi:hypothetical protein
MNACPAKTTWPADPFSGRASVADAASADCGRLATGYWPRPASGAMHQELAQWDAYHARTDMAARSRSTADLARRAWCAARQ